VRVVVRGTLQGRPVEVVWDRGELSGDEMAVQQLLALEGVEPVRTMPDGSVVLAMLDTVESALDSISSWFDSIQMIDGPLTAMDLTDYMHDGWVDLDDVVEEPGVIIVRGMIEQLLPTRRTRLGRFLFELRVEGQLTAVEDDEGIGRVPVNTVTYTDGVLRIDGSIGRIVIATSTGEGRLTVAPEPVEVRRWLRWPPVG
jgi:hypothetical protein